VFAGHDVIDCDVNQRLKIGFAAAALGFDHRSGHCPAIIESARR
jgi:hypothetical protein